MGGTASLAQGVASVGAAYNESEDLKFQGQYQRKQYDFNAQLAELQANDSIKRGEKEATAHKGRVKKLIGSQRVAMAAQGIEIDSGSALDVQMDTAAAGAEDALMIRNNAWREAWGHKVQAATYGAQGQMAQITAGAQARNSLLTGGMKAIGYGAEAYGSWKSSSSNTDGGGSGQRSYRTKG